MGLYLTVSFTSRIKTKNAQYSVFKSLFLVKEHTVGFTEFVLVSLELGPEIQLLRQNQCQLISAPNKPDMLFLEGHCKDQIFPSNLRTLISYGQKMDSGCMCPGISRAHAYLIPDISPGMPDIPPDSLNKFS